MFKSFSKNINKMNQYIFNNINMEIFNYLFKHSKMSPFLVAKMHGNPGPVIHRGSNNSADEITRGRRRYNVC